MNLVELLASIGVHIPPNELRVAEPGTRVRKTRSEPGDAHQDGATALVRGQVISHDGAIAIYLVEWDDTPGVACFVAAHRVVRLT